MDDSNPSEARFNSRHVARRADDEATSERGVLDQIVEVGRMGEDETGRERGRDLVKEFVAQVLDGSMTVTKDAEAMINQRIAQIDYLLSIQINEILHHPTFQKLEASWRGLWHLVDRVSWYQDVNVRILNAGKRELLRDLQNAASRRGSTLYRAVVDKRSEALGSEPFTMLMGNYTFGRGPEDMEMLERVTAIGMAAHAPFLTAAAPEMFGKDTFAEVLRDDNLNRVFDTNEYAKWKSFRRHASAKFAVLSLPQILLRKPYGRNHTLVDAFDYEEGIDGTDPSKLLWGNPAWALAAQLGRAFGKGSWSADPSSVSGGGVIRKLESFDFWADEGDIARDGPTDAPVSDSAYSELPDLGFTPICLDASSSRAVVYEMTTAYQPVEMEDEEGDVFKPPPTLLRDTLIHSRVAHYIKSIVREKRSWFQTPLQCEQYLNEWAGKYTVPMGSLFVHAQFHVVKDPRRPKGWFKVEGGVTPNLAQTEQSPPIDVSVPVLLTRAAAEWSPPVSPVPEAEPKAVRGEPQDSFSAASDALERISDLNRRGILNEPDYLELKGAIVGKMKTLAAPPRNASTIEDYAVPYGQIHSQIVEQIARSYGTGTDPKERAREAVLQMDERGALNTGDPPLLNELLDTALSDADKTHAPFLMDRIAEIVRKIRAHHASPACRAIAETAEQSGKRAVSEYASEDHLKATGIGSTLWRKLVWPDIEGAFSGGAAAATVAPTLSPFQIFWPVQIAAAFGVVLGAGIRSGVAYGERKDQTKIVAL